MASVEQRAPAETNGGTAAATIAVENPATGELITTIPVLGAERAGGDGRARPRRPSRSGRRSASTARARIMRRAQKWMLDNAERILDAVVSETRQDLRGRAARRPRVHGHRARASGPRRRPKYLADERVPSWNNPVAAGKKLVIRYAPVGVVGVIGPWNYPIANSFGDCIPALMAGNSVILKPSEVTPLSSLLMAEMMRECGLPEQRLPGRHRRRQHRARR